MTILSATTIRQRCEAPRFVSRMGGPMIEPWCERSTFHGMTYGLGHCGYDVRIAENVRLMPTGERAPSKFGALPLNMTSFALASTIERFNMPNDVMGRVTDKSTWARCGLAVQNTVIEPGWRGHLTLELTNHSDAPIAIVAGMPIAQIIFELLDFPVKVGYTGKYQDQPAGPQPPKYDHDDFLIGEPDTSDIPEVGEDWFRRAHLKYGR